MNTTIPADVEPQINNTTYDSVDDAADAFFKKMVSDAETPSEENEEAIADETEIEDEDTEGSSDDEIEETEADEEDADDGNAPVLDDDAITKVKIDGREVPVKVADLKRLYGQEASLTRKSQEVAAKRKALDDEGAKFVAATSVMLQRAKERYAPFENIDWLVAAQQYDAETLQSMRTIATDTYRDIQFLSQELEGYMGHVAQRRQAEKVEAAKAAIAELTDPEKGIPGFGEELYGELRSYATREAGIPAEIIDEIVEPWAIKVLHKAMMFDKSKKTVKTSPVDKAPKKIIKSKTNAETARSVAKTGHKSALDRLAQSGSIDDAADAFLNRWRDQ